MDYSKQRVRDAQIPHEVRQENLARLELRKAARGKGWLTKMTMEAMILIGYERKRKRYGFLEAIRACELEDFTDGAL